MTDEPTRAGPVHGPKLVTFLLTNAAIGVAAAVVMVGIAFAADFMNLRTLVSGNDAGLLAITVMTGLFAITFGSAQMGFALMFAMTDDGPPRNGRWQVVLKRFLPAWAPVPAVIVVPPSRRR